MDFDWSAHLAEQLSWHWEAQLRPRLAGLTDDEYFWEPVPGSWDTHRYAGTAAGALGQLDETYGAWMSGVRGLSNERLAAPTGPPEPFPDAPFADLVLHIHREAIHHGAEVSLLRDLYLRR